MYLRCSTLIQKRISRNNLLFVVAITFSVLMFHICTHISLLKTKNFEPHISTKNQAIQMIFNNKTYLFCSVL